MTDRTRTRIRINTTHTCTTHTRCTTHTYPDHRRRGSGIEIERGTP